MNKIKSKIAVYISALVFCIAFLFLSEVEAFPLGLRIAFGILQEVIFNGIISALLFTGVYKAYKKKRYIIILSIICAVNLGLKVFRQILYQLSDFGVITIYLFRFFIPAVILAAFIFERIEKKESLKSFKNVAFIVILGALSLFFLAGEISSICDMIMR